MMFFQETYNDVAMFFHDVFGGSFIAVVWKISAFKPQTFTVSGIIRCYTCRYQLDVIYLNMKADMRINCQTSRY